ncbi:MAG: molybdopterin molybdotransferase MoeA [Methylococcaceae bacterium]|nr:molybdopterin molybdotransferase MoeA [Methylococcaceae bacterium]
MTDPCSVEAKPLLTLDEALTRIKNTIQPIAEVEPVKLDTALGRVLAEDVRSPIRLPYDRNSAMDGYAFASKEIDLSKPFQLKLIGTAWAGKPFEGQLEPDSCVRIFTGAVVPDGVDSVVMQELASVENMFINFPAGIKPYQNIREAGEEIQQGGFLCGKGKTLSPADIGLLAAAGISHVHLRQCINIAYFSTGDELSPIGQPLTTGKIYDSNAYVLTGLLSDPRFDFIDLGTVSDTKQKLRNRIKRAADANDVIISTGGASVGEADYVKEILAELGEVNFWKIAVKPGKPLIFGKIGKCYYFGLPGNPVSMMITYQQIVAPALNWLSGAAPSKPLRFNAICTTTLKKSQGRQEFQRGILTQDENGQFFVATSGQQGSHILSSMSRSNCFIILPAESKGVSEGDVVLVEPFSLYL